MDLIETNIKHQLQLNSKLHVMQFMDCEKTFTTNSGLGVHVPSEHGQKKAFQCETCDNTFVLEWRMKMNVGGEGKK